MYRIIRALLFSLEAEKAHQISFATLNKAYALGLLGRARPAEGKSAVQVFGLSFKNRIGLAAGLDKNAVCLDALGALGFGFLEVGTLTPRAQDGNPQPRLFRVPEAQAIVNRMGFNNGGIDAAIPRIQQRVYTGPVGINIGKNKQTPNDAAVDDYLYGMGQAYAHADYLVVNISSPNTPELRALQGRSYLSPLLSALKNKQSDLTTKYGKYVPLLLKIAPDLETTDIHEIADVVLDYAIDGLIATNTTIDHHHIESYKNGREQGGVSGRPLFERSTDILKAFSDRMQAQVPMIASGGIMTVADAQRKIQAGAALCQIYTGFIYRGPAFIKQLIKAI